MRSGSVEVDGERVGAIGPGLVVLVGIGASDTAEHGERLARKIAELRVFGDERGRMGRSVADAGGGLLVVPQFTLYADVRKGRRPDLGGAATPEAGARLFDAFCGALRATGATVATGRFGAAMRVLIEGDGPVTIVASTDRWSESEL